MHPSSRTKPAPFQLHQTCTLPAKPNAVQLGRTLSQQSACQTMLCCASPCLALYPVMSCMLCSAWLLLELLTSGTTGPATGGKQDCTAQHEACPAGGASEQGCSVLMSPALWYPLLSSVVNFCSVLCGSQLCPATGAAGGDKQCWTDAAGGVARQCRPMLLVPVLYCCSCRVRSFPGLCCAAASCVLPQVLQEETSNIGQLQQDVRRAQQDVLSSRRLEESQQQLQQQRLADAEARLKKARLLVQGPPVPQVSPESTPETQPCCAAIRICAISCVMCRRTAAGRPRYLCSLHHPPVQCKGNGSI